MVVKANGDLLRLFGNSFGIVDEISDIFRKQTQHSVSYTQHLTVRQGLAPSFGQEANLKDNFRGLDDKLKILIAISNKELLKIPPDLRSWDRVHACFLTNSSARPMAEPVTVVAELPSNTTANFKFDGNPDPRLVQQVLHWWSDVAITDEDIRNDTKIDIEAMAKIVASSGAAVTNFFRLFHAYERREERVVDIGCLRYPDIAHPYFKIYRIELFAFSDCTRTLWHQTDTNGIRSVLTYRKFQPREDFIADIRQDTRRKALREVDDMFA